MKYRIRAILDGEAYYGGMIDSIPDDRCLLAQESIILHSDSGAVTLLTGEAYSRAVIQLIPLEV